MRWLLPIAIILGGCLGDGTVEGPPPVGDEPPGTWAPASEYRSHRNLTGEAWFPLNITASPAGRVTWFVLEAEPGPRPIHVIPQVVADVTTWGLLAFDMAGGQADLGMAHVRPMLHHSMGPETDPSSETSMPDLSRSFSGSMHASSPQLVLAVFARAAVETGFALAVSVDPMDAAGLAASLASARSRAELQPVEPVGSTTGFALDYFNSPGAPGGPGTLVPCSASNLDDEAWYTGNLTAVAEAAVPECGSRITTQMDHGQDGWTILYLQPGLLQGDATITADLQGRHEEGSFTFVGNDGVSTEGEQTQKPFYGVSVGTGGASFSMVESTVRPRGHTLIFHFSAAAPPPDWIGGTLRTCWTSPDFQGPLGLPEPWDRDTFCNAPPVNWDPVRF